MALEGVFRLPLTVYKNRLTARGKTPHDSARFESVLNSQGPGKAVESYYRLSARQAIRQAKKTPGFADLSREAQKDMIHTYTNIVTYIIGPLETALTILGLHQEAGEDLTGYWGEFGTDYLAGLFTTSQPKPKAV